MSCLKIIYSDELLIVIDKPAGLPSTSLKVGEKDTLAARIVDEFPDQAKVRHGKLEAGLVHRLDNLTSGVIVAARTNAAYDNLRAQFDTGDVDKKYSALVVGSPPSEGRVDYPIAHHPRKKREMIVCRTQKEAARLGARAALTRFRVDERFDYKGTKYALLTVEIKTGVRHQIRAHLASIGCPVAGDKVYQNAKIRRADNIPLDRHFLHAVKISFKHPATGLKATFVSPLHDELEKILKPLRGHAKKYGDLHK